MNEQEKILAAHREVVLNNWKLLAERARLAGMHELADHAQAQVDLQEPPTGARVGDQISKLTSFLGVKPCGDCKKRQAALNKIDTGRPVGEVVAQAMKAILQPDEAIRSS